MAYVDAIHDRDRDRVYVVERVNGQRKYVEYPADYIFYYDDPRGKFKSIFDTPLSRFTSRSYKEFRKELRMHSGRRVYESDFKPVHRCLETHYKDQDAPTLHTAFFDIEVDFHKERGYSPVNDPFNAITAITIYLDWLEQLVTLAIPPKGLTMEEAKEICNPFDNTFLFDDERDLLNAFLDIIEDADVLSGWNSEGFDIPYTVNRITRLLSKDDTRRFCLWGKLPKKRMFERFGAENETYDLVGRVHMDYMQLYRKYTYHEMHSYSLDAIGEYELKERKVAYEGTLDQLYNQDFKTFIDYSRQDVLLLAKLDNKLKFLDLANELAHANTVLLQTTMGAVAVTEQAIVNEAHEKGLIVPNKVSLDPSIDTRAAGAYVAYPKKGIHKWVGSVDINSLYPSAIRALNMGPETIVGQLRPIETDKYIQDKMADKVDPLSGKVRKGCSFADAWEGLFGSLEYTAVMDRREDFQVTIDWDQNGSDALTTFGKLAGDTTISARDAHDLIFNGGQPWVLSANGTIFSLSRPGIIPELLQRWYAERKVLQKKKGQYEMLKKGIALPERFANA